jgi:hypothetical protein
LRKARRGILAPLGNIARLLVFLLGCTEPEPAHTFIPNFRAAELDAFGALHARAVMVSGDAVPPPAGGPLRPAEEAPMQGAGGDGLGSELPGRRSPSFRPDRVTELEGTLGYYEVFSPSIAPFKRVTALDHVRLEDRTPVLAVADPSPRPVSIEGLDSAPPDSRERDRFWGSVVLDFGEGLRLPLPSVSPESRVLVAQTVPSVAFHIERDSADNFFIVADQAPAEAVRLTYVLDAPRSYFGAALPLTRADALMDRAGQLPERVGRDAITFAQELGLARDHPSTDVLRKLAEHFRSFEESREPPPDTGNIYLDLAREQRGVCRHRSYAFVITAIGLGIPARFVQNEAHAWAEVKVAGVGWMRLDLGGAAEGLEGHSLDDRPAYRSNVPDPWPRPLAYEESYSRAAELAAARADKARAKGAMQRGDETRAPGDMRLKPTLALGRGEQSLPLVDDDREPISLRVARYLPEVMRGSVLEVEGVAEDEAGRAVDGLRIEVSLADPTSDRALLLGVTVTAQGGRFRGSFAVPPNLDPADYALVVVTPGDGKHAAARAE